jgi:competence protein ComEA
MNPWQWLKDYFDLNKSERRGIAVLLVIIALLIIIPYFYPLIFHPKAYDYSAIQRLALQSRTKNKDSIVSSDNEISVPDLEKENQAKEYHLKTFDPNYASLEELISLGIKPKIAETILKYRAKGGHFRKKEDMLKVYGLKPELYNRIEPYITIESGQKPFEKDKTTYQKTTKEVVNVEINSADSETLLKVKGIGPAFASRIIKYRKLTGGYLKKEQLLEVYGLDSERYSGIEGQVTLNPVAITKIHINSISLDELKRNPYLRYKLANAIIRYREQHGNFSSIDDLRKIKLLDEGTIGKIGGYIDFGF